MASGLKDTSKYKQYHQRKHTGFCRRLHPRFDSRGARDGTVVTATSAFVLRAV